jgi:uncharacterized protein (DUF433 family)
MASMPNHSRDSSGLQPPISRDPDVHSGAAVFAGKRVPVYILFRYLEQDDALAEFLRAYPHVGADAARAVLEHAKRALVGADDPDDPRCAD